MINLIYEAEPVLSLTFEDILFSSFAIAAYILCYFLLYKYKSKLIKNLRILLTFLLLIGAILVWFLTNSIPGIAWSIVMFLIGLKIAPFNLSVRNIQENRDAEKFCKVDADLDTSQKSQYDECIRQGKFFYNEGSFTKACDKFVDSLPINPISDEAWYMIGVINFNRQMYKEAKKALYTALINNENHVEARNLYKKLKQMETENKTDID